MEGERFNYGLMAETGREERGGILKGVMSYSHLLKKQRNLSYINKKPDSFQSRTIPNCKHVRCTKKYAKKPAKLANQKKIWKEKRLNYAV
jgi:hypothetical protein